MGKSLPPPLTQLMVSSCAQSIDYESFLRLEIDGDSLIDCLHAFFSDEMVLSLGLLMFVALTHSRSSKTARVSALWHIAKGLSTVVGPSH